MGLPGMRHPARICRAASLANGPHPGTRVPRSRRHKLMNSNGDGGPARTRTWDQGIMSNRISSRSSKESRRSLNAFPVSLPTADPTNDPERRPKSGGMCCAEKSIGHIELRIRTDRTGPNGRDGSRGVGGGVSRECLVTGQLGTTGSSYISTCQRTRYDRGGGGGGGGGGGKILC